MGSPPPPPLQDVGKREERQRRRDSERDRQTHTQTSTKNKERETHTYTLVTRQTDPERDKGRRRDGGTEDIKMETPKRQTRLRRIKEMQGGKGRREGEIGKNQGKKGDLEGKLQAGCWALDLAGAGSADPGLEPLAEASGSGARVFLA